MRRTRTGFVPTETITGRADGDDFEALCIMDRYFCKAQNPDNGVLEKYLPLVKKESHFGYKRHIATFKSRGFEEEDVFSLALCYAVSFIGLYSLQSSKERMDAFVKRYQEKHLTEKMPPEEVIFKKNSSDLVDFLKQKIQQLSLVVKKKGHGIAMFKEKNTYYKTQSSRQSVREGKNGSFVEIQKQEYVKAKKTSGIKSNEFELDGWVYFFVSREPPVISNFSSFSKKDEDEEMNEDYFFDKCGSIDTVDYLSDSFDLYTKEQKIKMLQAFIKKTTYKKTKELAQEMLKELIG